MPCMSYALTLWGSVCFVVRVGGRASGAFLASATRATMAFKAPRRPSGAFLASHSTLDAFGTRQRVLRAPTRSRENRPTRACVHRIFHLGVLQAFAAL